MSDRATPLRDSATLTEAAYEALRIDIIRGARAPGERLRIERLKQLYEVGPTPLREALQRLSADGLVVANGNRGFSVVTLDIAEFDDINIARTAVETEALRLSIANGDDAWEAGIVSAAYRMEKADAELAASGSETLDRWEETNDAFHHAMVAACGSNWLLRIRKNLHDQCERYRRASVYLRRGDRNLRSEHKAIAEAVLARDTERACALTQAHYARTASNLAEDFATRTPSSGKDSRTGTGAQ
ncbi:GntR family transcriptional regulator [Rhodobacteraceae bacterium WD3A24]|nr:GntR family transcriptional regulator [Rhodobacteraceae bacterium WD3A24]